MHKGRAPDTMDEWMRQVEKRLRAVERHRHSALSTPSWKVHENENGDLVATHTSGITRIIEAAP